MASFRNLMRASYVPFPLARTPLTPVPRRERAWGAAIAPAGGAGTANGRAAFSAAPAAARRMAEERSGASIARARAGAGPAPAGSPPSCGKLRNSSLNPSSRAAASHARAADSLSL